VLEIKEGDFVMGSTSEGIMHGVVEHIMDDGGTLGTPGSEYALESMPPENPAMSVRVYKKENGTWKPTAYSIGMMYKDAKIDNINDNPANMDSEMADDSGVAMAMYDSQMVKAKKPNYSEMIKPRSGGSYKIDQESTTENIWDGSFDPRNF